jgi:hypothetical protein
VPRCLRSKEGPVHEVLTQSDDPAGALIEAACERRGRDTPVALALLWLLVALVGLPLIVNLSRAAFALG